jgi:hypothetical protein
MLNIERYKAPSSNTKLREIKNKILEATCAEKGCVTHEITIHFFEDCILGFHVKSNTGTYPTLTHKVYSKDFGKTWFKYEDQFEPKEGYHKAVQYKPTEESFPTLIW